MNPEIPDYQAQGTSRNPWIPVPRPVMHKTELRHLLQAEQIQKILVISAGTSAQFGGDPKIGETILNVYPIVMAAVEAFPGAELEVLADVPSLFDLPFAAHLRIRSARFRLAGSLHSHSAELCRFIQKGGFNLVLVLCNPAEAASVFVGRIYQTTCNEPPPFILGFRHATSYLSGIANRIDLPSLTDGSAAFTLVPPCFVDRSGSRIAVQGFKDHSGITVDPASRVTAIASGWTISNRIGSTLLPEAHWRAPRLPVSDAASDLASAAFQRALSRAANQDFVPNPGSFKNHLILNLHAHSQNVMTQEVVWPVLADALQRILEHPAADGVPVKIVLSTGRPGLDDPSKALRFAAMFRRIFPGRRRDFLILEQEEDRSIHAILSVIARQGGAVLTPDTGFSHMARMHDLTQAVLTNDNILQWFPDGANSIPVFVPDRRYTPAALFEITRSIEFFCSQWLTPDQLAESRVASQVPMNLRMLAGAILKSQAFAPVLEFGGTGRAEILPETASLLEKPSRTPLELRILLSEINSLLCEAQHAGCALRVTAVREWIEEQTADFCHQSRVRLDRVLHEINRRIELGCFEIADRETVRQVLDSESSRLDPAHALELNQAALSYWKKASSELQ